MSLPSNVVSIHPYFKAHPGQMETIRPLLTAFVEKTKSEPDVVYYEFTINGDVVFCREGYRGAEGALAHLQNVGDLLTEMLRHTDLIRLELHGPEEELAKLRGPLADYPVEWYALVGAE